MPINENDLRDQFSERSQEYERLIAEKEKVLSDYRKERGKLEVFFEKITRSITPIEPLQIIYNEKSEKTECEAVIQISDGHYGAVQGSEEIEGFNRFDPVICKNRQLYFIKGFLGWVELMRNGYRIDNLSVLCTGDLISGDIHEELKVTNAFPVPQQIVGASQILAEQIGLLAPHFNKVTIHFISADNHGRLTRKPQSKEEGVNSFNYLVGMMAQAYTSKHSNVEFNVYPMFEKVVAVANRQYLISHGHNLTGWMGIPWYSVQRHIGKEAMARLEIIMNEQSRMKEIGFHKYVFGHYHTPISHPHYSCSGSVSGTDAYDHKSGRHADPSQPAWLVHPKHGDFNRIDFNLKSII